jgi:hypothetical protein
VVYRRPLKAVGLSCKPRHKLLGKALLRDALVFAGWHHVVHRR